MRRGWHGGEYGGLIDDLAVLVEVQELVKELLGVGLGVIGGWLNEAIKRRGRPERHGGQ